MHQFLILKKKNNCCGFDSVLIYLPVEPKREESPESNTMSAVTSGSDGVCHMTVLGSARLTVYILGCRCDSVSSVSLETSSSSSSSSGSAR